MSWNTLSGERAGRSLRIFIVILLALSAMGAHAESFRKGTLYDLGFSDYSHYTGDRNEGRKSSCERQLGREKKPGDKSLAFRLNCEVIVGNPEDSIPALEDLGENGNPYAIDFLSYIFHTRGHSATRIDDFAP